MQKLCAFILMLSLTLVSFAAMGKREARRIRSQCPVPVVCEPAQVWNVALTQANQYGYEVMRGVGNSMEPVYQNDTVLLVDKNVTREDIKPGMLLIFMKANRSCVAHVAQYDMPKGWVTKGVNNSQEDPRLVNDQTLIGIVRVAITAQRTKFWE